MKNKIYSIYDRKSGTYSKIFDCPNDEFASREFCNVYSRPDLRYMSSDVELYCLGQVNYEKGKIDSYRKPKFVCSVSDSQYVVDENGDDLIDG